MPLKFKVKVQLAIKDMTQKQLAEATGIRPPTVSAICTGAVKQIPVSALERICDKLDCQPGDLIEYVPDEAALRDRYNQAFTVQPEAGDA